MDSSLEQNIKSFHRNLPDNVTLVAVSNLNPFTAILESYIAG